MLESKSGQLIVMRRPGVEEECSQDDCVLKYPSFNLLNDTEKTIFLFNNSDSFVCKKLGYFIYEALNIRETFNLI